MWIRRSDLEIKQFEERQQRKRRSLLRPIFWGAVWSIGLSLLYYLGYRGRGRFAYHSTFGPVDIVFGIIVFAVVAGIVDRSQRRGRDVFDDTGLLCSDCLTPSSPYGCPCGGILEPYEYYTWEEDEIRLDTPNTATQN